MTDELREDVDREALKQAARESAWDEHKDCEACGGDGKVPGGRQLIHTRSLSGFGADWDLESIEKYIDEADYLRWAHGPFSAVLVAAKGGTEYAFEIRKPGVSL